MFQPFPHLNLAGSHGLILSSVEAWDPDLTSGLGCTTTAPLLGLQLDELVWLADFLGHKVFGGNPD